MKRETRDNFNLVMSNLKTIEPSDSFDFEFRRRFEKAVAEKYTQTAFEKLARRTVESIRHALLPRTPRLVRVAVTVVFLATFGLYMYSAQPANPFLASKQGIVMAKSAGDVSWREVSLRDTFKPGDVITMRRNSGLDISLPGKYAIKLKGKTKIKIAQLTPRYGNGKARFELADGQMLVDVEKGFKGSRFIVDTKTATATALGTKFAVNVSRGKKHKTQVSVLEGKVKVKSQYKPKKFQVTAQTVTVGSGQKTEVSTGEVPLAPQRLIEEEWRKLEELYQIGKKPQVMLLVKNTPNRTKELLRPCPIYISDELGKVSELLREAVSSIKEAIKKGDMAKHLEAVKLLEQIVEEHPNASYDVQFLLYIGAYYDYLGYNKQAIETFKKVIKNYPDSTLASMAQCAIGIIYEEKLHDKEKAEAAYKTLLEKYPNSLDAIWAEKKLRMKKLATNIK